MTDPGSINLRVDVDTKSVRTMLTRLAAVTSRPEGALRILGQTIVDDLVLPAFDDQRSPDGKPWPPPKPATLAARARRGKRGTLALIETAELRNSFNYQITDGGTTLRVGTPRRDAVYHQGDDTRPRRVIPERAMLPKPTATGSLGAKASRVINHALEDALREFTR